MVSGARIELATGGFESGSTDSVLGVGFANKKYGVGGEDRTRDPRLMSPVLYRLSYPDIYKLFGLSKIAARYV